MSDPVAANSVRSKRIALVIGNSDYQSLPKLINPKNDTEAVKLALQESGFHVVVGHDLGRKSLEDLIRDFLRSHDDESDVSMIYYSGHGVQIAGKNYLVPIDATFKTIYDVETEAVNLDIALQYMKSHSKTQLFFLDACRDNPFRDSKFGLQTNWRLSTGGPG